MLKTIEEIKERIRGVKGTLEFESGTLLPYLEWEDAKEFVHKDMVKDLEERWKVLPCTRDSVLKEAREYMQFSWGKVQNHRGLSASRSVDRMRAWCWLLGKEDSIDWGNYAQYGAPILADVCVTLGFPMPDSDDVINMAKGLPCTPNCDMGCGK